jgi:hypothetical protein
MPHPPSLPEGARLLHALRRLPHTARPLLEHDEVLLRGRSPLPAPEREPVAAPAETASPGACSSQPAA